MSHLDLEELMAEVNSKNHVLYLAGVGDSRIELPEAVYDVDRHVARSSSVEFLKHNSDNSKYVLVVLLDGVIPEEESDLQQFWDSGIPVCRLNNVSGLKRHETDWLAELSDFKVRILEVYVTADDCSDLISLLEIVCKKS